MTPRPYAVAVVLAGGSGSRVGADIPKQLLLLAGRTVLEHAVEAFQAVPGVDEIVVVSHADHEDAARRLTAGADKVSRVVAGGPTRSASTRVALSALAGVPADTIVMLHDAARPLVSGRIIGAVLEALERYDAVDVAVPVTDTMVTVDDAGIVTGVPDRSSLRRSQTPQGFRLSTIAAAYELALADPDFIPTDECSVVHRYLPGVPVAVVPGSEDNLKITQPVDLVLAEAVLRARSAARPER